MIRGTLVTALDFAARKGVKVEAYSYRKLGQWFIVTSGPRYCNITKVTEYDAEGERLLLAKEVNLATGERIAPDKAPDTNPSA